MGIGAMISSLADEELLIRGDAIVRYERRGQAILLAIIGEIDRRRLYLGLAYPHMFAFCVGRWGYARDAAYRRLHAARACLKYPEALSLVDDGSLQLSGLATLEPFLQEHGGLALLERAKGMGRREVEQLVAAIAPKPDVADTVRSLTRVDAHSSAATMPTEAMTELHMEAHDRTMSTAPERVQFSFTGSEDLRSLLIRLRDILWNKFPFARLEDLILEAVREYLERHDPQRKLKLAEPRLARPEETRRVPQWVRDRVWARDKGRCAFLSQDGRRCEATAGLELDHVLPWARGGRSDDPENVRLLCRAHNQERARASWSGGSAAPPPVRRPAPPTG
jgi:hypothetical protein